MTTAGWEGDRSELHSIALVLREKKNPSPYLVTPRQNFQLSTYLQETSKINMVSTLQMVEGFHLNPQEKNP